MADSFLDMATGSPIPVFFSGTHSTKDLLVIEAGLCMTARRSFLLQMSKSRYPVSYSVNRIHYIQVRLSH